MINSEKIIKMNAEELDKISGGKRHLTVDNMVEIFVMVQALVTAGVSFVAGDLFDKKIEDGTYTCVSDVPDIELVRCVFAPLVSGGVVAAGTVALLSGICYVK